MYLKHCLNEKVVILKPDGIGDYVLFRTFFKNIEEKNTSYLFVGSRVVCDLSRKADANFFCYWLSIRPVLVFSSKFYRFYLKYLFKLLRVRKIIYAVNSRDSRMEDFLEYANIQAVGFRGDLVNSPLDQASGQAYKISGSVVTSGHEIYRYKQLVETLFEVKINNVILSPLLLKPKQMNRVVVSPYAKDPEREWNLKNYFELIRMILGHYQELEVVLIGDRSDDLFNRLDLGSSKMFQDFRGKGVFESASIVASARYFIGPDSGMLHIAAAQGCDILCLSNANHLFRFIPYPAAFANIKYVLPKANLFQQNLKASELEEIFSTGSALDINTIGVNCAFNAFKEII